MKSEIGRTKIGENYRQKAVTLGSESGIQNGPVFHTIPFEQVPQAIKKLQEEYENLYYKEQSEEEYIKGVTKIYADFIFIQPYEDGNKRTALSLLNSMLISKNIIPPPISLVNDQEMVQAYYKAQEKDYEMLQKLVVQKCAVVNNINTSGNDKFNNIKNININNIDLESSFFHFTVKDNLEKIDEEGLKPQIGEASKMKSEEKPRVYLAKGEKGLIGIKNSFIREFKKLKICDIPEGYRKYFNIADFSSIEQVKENDVYDAMEKRFRNEVFFMVDAIEDEDFIIEDSYSEGMKEDFSKETLKIMFDKNPQRDVKGKANHTVEPQKLSLIGSERGNDALKLTKILYNRLLDEAKKSGKEKYVKMEYSELDSFFDYIKQKEKTFDD